MFHQRLHSSSPQTPAAGFPGPQWIPQQEHGQKHLSSGPALQQQVPSTPAQDTNMAANKSIDAIAFFTNTLHV